jgi:hypothetical protein
MSVTGVSCYFPIKNKHGNKYTEWFKTSLRINCPYVFFTTSALVPLIKSCRGDLPTHFIECEISDFYTYPFKDKISPHEYHCPSVELNLIWNEKITMVEKAAAINPFQSDWFMWVDAGICIYRDCTPSIAVPCVKNLPLDRLIFSSSDSPTFNCELVLPDSYYHYVSGTYILHKHMIPKMAALYREYFEKLVDDKNIWTDQVILTHMYKDYPELFYKLCDGYGEVIRYLLI